MRRLAALAVVFGLVVVACSDSDDDAGGDSTSRVVDDGSSTSAAPLADDASTTTASTLPITTTTVPATTSTTTTTTTMTTTTTTTMPPPIETTRFAGDGPDVIALDGPFERAAVAVVTHAGEGDFVLRILDEDGETVQGVVGGTGNYEGAVTVNMDGDEPFAFIDMEADGPWTVTLQDPTSRPSLETTPGSVYRGAGEEVLRFVTDGPTLIEFVCRQCGEDLRVRSWDGDDMDAIIRADGPYDGRRLVERGAQILIVRTSSSDESPAWTLRVVE